MTDKTTPTEISDDALDAAGATGAGTRSSILKPRSTDTDLDSDSIRANGVRANGVRANFYLGDDGKS